MTARTRTCPMCGALGGEPVLSLTVRQVLDGNAGYLPEHYPEFERLIGLDARVTVVRCSCGFHFGGQIPDPVLLDFDYGVVNCTEESRQRVYELERRRTRVETWARLLGVFDRPLFNVRAVDFGCGWGDVLAMVKSPGVEVIGIEQNPSQVEFAEAHGVEVRPEIDDVEPGSVDFLLANQVLEHVLEPRSVLEGLRRLMRQGSVAYLSVPDFTRYPWKRAQSAIDEGQVITRLINPWEHLNYFDRPSFHALLRETGFEPSPPSIRGRAEVLARVVLRRTTGIEAFCRVAQPVVAR